jgi:hypothetical protein
VVAFSAGDAAYVGLAVFLVAVGLAGAWALLRLSVTFDRLSSLLRGTERDLLPVATKLGGTVDRVNAQLDKLDPATDSAVDAVVAADHAVRSLSFAISRPVQKLTGLSAGVANGLSSLRARNGWRQAVADGRDAASRRERDFEEELKQPHG